MLRIEVQGALVLKHTSGCGDEFEFKSNTLCIPEGTFIFADYVKSRLTRRGSFIRVYLPEIKKLQN